MSKAWTEAEKLGVLFQIIEKGGPIPWDKITLPEGRTQKAVTVMIDREKGKVRKAREANGEDGDQPSGKAKRRAGDDGGATPTSKRPKTPRKKKETSEAESVGEAAAEDGDVKPEPEDEDEDEEVDVFAV